MKTVLHSEIVFDMSLYPRGEVDDERVAILRDVLDAGGTLPPIIIDDRRRIVDGFHRAKAHRQANNGVDVAIPCEVREYANDAELLLDAIGLNAEHGKPLSTADRCKCVVLAERHGVTVAQLADVLHVRVKKLTSIAQASTTKATVAAAEKRLSDREMRWRSGEGSPEGSRPLPGGLKEINALSVALQNGTVEHQRPEIRRSLKALAAVIAERLEGIAV